MQKVCKLYLQENHFLAHILPIVSFFKDFIYLRERTRTGGGAEGEADFFFFFKGVSFFKIKGNSVILAPLLQPYTFISKAPIKDNVNRC